jgi:hypothetical protein
MIADESTCTPSHSQSINQSINQSAQRNIVIHIDHSTGRSLKTMTYYQSLQRERWPTLQYDWSRLAWSSCASCEGEEKGVAAMSCSGGELVHAVRAGGGGRAMVE